MSRVRWRSSSPAFVYDSKHDRLLKVVRKIDTKGREWEEFGVWGDEGFSVYTVPVEAPEEPKQPKRVRK